MARVRLHPSGRAVECQPGDTVLQALERAGYALPNNCRAGACGECKVKVREGAFDQGIVLDMALSAEERAAGFGLMCMAKPLGDELVIEWGTDDAQPKLFPPREDQPFVVVDRIVRTPRIVELRLRPLGAPMRFWPGQYVMLGDPARGVPPRCYSIANAPRPDGEICVQVTRMEPGRTSAWAHDLLAVGDTTLVSGPYGTFIGDPSVDTPVLCLAAGSGLAPILSLAEAALRRGYRQAVTLLVSARTRADLYDEGLMAWWQAKHRNFRYRATLTRETGGELHGRIPAILPQLFADLSAFSVFIAGSPAFVEDCVRAVKALGAADARIHTERYVPQQPPEVPADHRLVQIDDRA
jgi:CDP-4-dehydro-6-deoxyglucose reductase